jgi:hypothetical protein
MMDSFLECLCNSLIDFNDMILYYNQIVITLFIQSIYNNSIALRILIIICIEYLSIDVIVSNESRYRDKSNAKSTHPRVRVAFIF